MKNKILTAALIIVGIIALFFIRTQYSGYNLNKTIQACILAKKQTSNSFNIEEAKELCSDKIKKKINRKD